MFDRLVNSSNKAILILASLCLLSLIGCGYNPEDPIYDTAGNPANYPVPALDLINMVELGEKLAVEDVIAAFVELYSSNQELLDDDGWREIVNRIGLKLKIRADEMAASGVEQFETAADYYHLASFARPNDPKIQHRSDLFGCWKADDTKDLLRLGMANESGLTAGNLRESVEAFKRFAYTDSMHFEFASTILIDPLMKSEYRENAASSSLLDSLSIADRAFLTCWELATQVFDSSLCSFEKPELDLLRLELVALGDQQYRAELYFMPQVQPVNDFTVALWVDAAPEGQPQSAESRALYLPFDFFPLPATSGWRPGQMTVAIRNFKSSGEIQKVSLGLYLKGEKQVRYVPIKGIDGNLITVPVSVRPVG